jgi:hypothetical protein
MVSLGLLSMPSSPSEFLGGIRNSLAGVAISYWFIETSAGWVLASSVCA